MNNIQQQIDIVSRLPDDVLLMKAQKGDPSIPQWAFVSEIDDRTRTRKASEASQQAQPKVAQRVVQEGIAALQPAQPQNLMGMQQPMQQPMQGMYAGGAVRMNDGRMLPNLINTNVNNMASMQGFDKIIADAISNGIPIETLQQQVGLQFGEQAAADVAQEYARSISPPMNFEEQMVQEMESFNPDLYALNQRPDAAANLPTITMPNQDVMALDRENASRREEALASLSQPITGAETLDSPDMLVSEKVGNPVIRTLDQIGAANNARQAELAAIANPTNIRMPKITNASGDVTDNPSGALIEDANSFSLQRAMTNAQVDAPRDFDESVLGRMVAKGTDAVENFSLVPTDYSKFPYTRPPIEGEPLFSNTVVSGSLDVDGDKLLNRFQGLLGGIENASETSDGSFNEVMAAVSDDGRRSQLSSDQILSKARPNQDAMDSEQILSAAGDNVSGQGIDTSLAENLIARGSTTGPEGAEGDALRDLSSDVAGAVREQATGLSQYLAAQAGNESDTDKRILSQALMYIGAGLMKNDLAGGIENAAKATTGIREKQIGRQEKALDRKLQQTYYDTRRTEAERDRDLRLSTADQGAQARLERSVEDALTKEIKNVNSDLVSLRATATKGDPDAIEKLRRREADLRAQFAREIGSRSGISSAIIDRYIATLPSAPPSGSLTSRKYSITEVK